MYYLKTGKELKEEEDKKNIFKEEKVALEEEIQILKT